MITLIPHKQISIETNHSVDKAMSLVSGITFTEPLSRFQKITFPGSYGKLYEGYIHPDGFRIKGIITHSRGFYFLPILDGRFTPTSNGVRVNIHWSLHPFVIVLMLTIFAGIAFILSFVIYNWMTTGNIYSERAYVALASLVFLYTLFYWFARLEANISEKMMVWLFTQKPI
jgi:hypothetical protein